MQGLVTVWLILAVIEELNELSIVITLSDFGAWATEYSIQSVPIKLGKIYWWFFV